MKYFMMFLCVILGIVCGYEYSTIKYSSKIKSLENDLAFANIKIESDKIAFNQYVENNNELDFLVADSTSCFEKEKTKMKEDFEKKRLVFSECRFKIEMAKFIKIKYEEMLGK